VFNRISLISERQNQCSLAQLVFALCIHVHNPIQRQKLQPTRRHLAQLQSKLLCGLLRTQCTRQDGALPVSSNQRVP
jgi:hypothetical protein